MMEMAQKDLLSFADPELARSKLGIQNSEIWDRFVSEPVVREFLCKNLARVLGPVTPPQKDEELLVNCISNFSQEQLLQLAKVTTCLVQAPSISQILSGKKLKEISDYCGTPSVIRTINSEPLPVFAAIPKPNHISVNVLDYYKNRVLEVIAGLMPDGYAERLRLKFPKDTLPEPKPFSPNSQDRKAIAYLLSVGCQIVLESMDQEDAED